MTSIRCVAVVAFVQAVCACNSASTQIEAIEPIPVFATLQASNTPDETGVIERLEHGERIDLLKCVDIKSDIVYRVRLADGREGYINGVRPYRFIKNGRLVESDDAC